MKKERKKESYGKQMKVLQDKATPVKEGREEKEGGREGRKGGGGK